MSDTVIRIQNLSKCYRIGERQSGYRTFGETLVDAFVAPYHRIRSLLHSSTINASKSKVNEKGNESGILWALRDISFEVHQGEVLGVIGRNGAGKSTLLKILSKITEPTNGKVELQGRVGSLLEVGTGFHPELTGHENIYLYGAIMGMDRYEISKKFDEIIAFSGLRRFINTPVKRYSSGMYTRLAFAVAAHLDSEILLIDEVLAVGDSRFQKKCLRKMEEVGLSGRTVVFISHNMAMISSLCSNAILLENGELKAFGSCEQVILNYETSGFQSPSNFQKKRDAIHD